MSQIGLAFFIDYYYDKIMNKKINGFSSIWIILSAFILLVVTGSFFYFHSPSNTNTQQTGQMGDGNPTVTVNDMAPSLSDTEKTAILIRHSDSSYEKVIIPNEKVNTYITNLPDGDTVVGKISPAK